jgi:hypothetical protein
MRRRVTIVLFFAAVFIAVLYFANWHESDADTDQGKSLDKDGSVETAISVQHADSTHDIILTSHKVWIRNKEYATIVHRDTVPSLDSMNTSAENEDGNTQQVHLKKDYQLFITVK